MSMNCVICVFIMFLYSFSAVSKYAMSVQRKHVHDIRFVWCHFRFCYQRSQYDYVWNLCFLFWNLYWNRKLSQMPAHFHISFQLLSQQDTQVIYNTPCIYSQIMAFFFRVWKKALGHHYFCKKKQVKYKITSPTKTPD
jgi:hypothetical protein